MDELRVGVPFSKPDISLPADIVEEILRIDGLDNVEFNSHMTFSPAIDQNITREVLREKISGYLVGLGFNEIMTNSITNSQYFSEAQLQSAVKMINNLSADLDVLRLSMLETGLETIAYNLNRKNNNLLFFEFGRTYEGNGVGNYKETEHLALYLTGKAGNDTWKGKAPFIDLYKAKGIAEALLQVNGIDVPEWQPSTEEGASLALQLSIQNYVLVTVSEVSNHKLKSFDIKQPVYFIHVNWAMLIQLVDSKHITYKEVAKYPVVERDLAIVIDKEITFSQVESVINKSNNNKLKQVRLFDVFESEKLGVAKKSFAINFTFLDEEKTLTDKEIDSMMNRIIQLFEKDLEAEIRK